MIYLGFYILFIVDSLISDYHWYPSGPSFELSETDISEPETPG